MGDFVHLHLHTEYSLLDGMARIKQVFDKCRKLGMKSVAITDHGNMYGAYQFYCNEQKRINKIAEEKGKEAAEQAERERVKPIIGCEFYVADNMYKKEGRADREYYHLILLAKDNIGYRNLVLLNSYSFVDGYYYKPRIDFNLLSKHSEGLICMSACIGGELPQLLLANRPDDAEQLLLKYKNLFGEDYYVEIQDHGLSEERYVNPKLIELARKHNIGLVATNDAHYINKADAEAHDILLCVQTARYVDEENRMRFTGQEFYMKTAQEMEDLFSYVPEALENTVKIADKCNVTIAKEKLLPNYFPPDGSTPEEYLKNLVEKGLAEKYGLPLPKEVEERYQYEFSVIKRMGFIEYYLIVWDFIHYAENQGIAVGPGRGSGASSIIAYAIGITKVEPLAYNLIFERFLNPERVSMPDFDIDFCMDRRGEVIDYVVEKYGEDNVCQIITFGTMGAKNSIKDVARAMRVPYSDSDKWCKLVANNVTIRQLLGFEKGEKGADVSVPEIINDYNSNEKVKKVFDIAIQLEGLPRQSSKHAAGVVICRDKIRNHVPLQRKDKSITTQYNMKEVEQLGLLKIDFLGLTNLTDIDKTVKMVKKTRGIDVNINSLTYDDPNVYKLISQGDTESVFQLESGGMRKLMQDLQPNCLEDIIAGISLYRPGPMQFIPDYVAGKKNQDKVHYAHPILKNILQNTYGCMVYQEQIMQIVREMGGFSFGAADTVRRAMGKKDLVEMQNQRRYFLYGKKGADGESSICGALAKGVPEDVANEIFDKMTDFANYAFNKPHAAGYAIIAYQTAMLKCYYLPEFLASVMTNRLTKTDDIKKYVAYALDRGIDVKIPDINTSDVGFTVKDGAILFGLAAIKGIGANAMTKIIEEREKNGKYKSLDDFLRRIDKYSGGETIEEKTLLNKRSVEGLIKAGAFDSLGQKRAEMMATYTPIMEKVAQQRKVRETGQMSLFDIMGEEELCDDIRIEGIKEFGQKYLLSMEKEVLGMYISGNPLLEHTEKLRSFSFNTSHLSVDMDDEEARAALQAEYDGKRVTAGGSLSAVRKTTTRAGKPICYARLDDLYGSVELLIFGSVLERYRSIIEDDQLVTITGTIGARQDDTIKIFVDSVVGWSQQQEVEQVAPQESGSTLYLRMMQKDNELYENLSTILSRYVGDIPVILVIGQNKYAMPYKVRDCTGLVYELNNLLGQVNVKIVNKE